MTSPALSAAAYNPAMTTEPVKRIGGHAIAAGLALLMIASAAQADVYQCQKDGVTVFSDKPCAADAQTYHPAHPVQVIPHVDAPDLAKQYDDKVQQGRKARDQAYAQSNSEYQAQKDEDERLHSAMVQGKVVVGMSAAQVRTLMGTPLGTRRQARKGSVTEVWTYQQKDGSRLAVSLKDGKVVSLYEKRGRSK